MKLVEHADQIAYASASHDEILRAAAELFMEFGYTATSIDAVAKRLGSTKGRIYHHFRSKADLFFAVQISAMTRLLTEIEPIASAAGDPIERLGLMALRHTQILLAEMPMQKVAVQGLERHLLGASATRHMKTLRSIIKMRDDYEQLFAEVIDAGIRKGLFVDLPVKLATKPFFGALNWATIWYSQRRLQKADEINEIAYELAAFALRGILKGPSHDATQAALLRHRLG
ncbi:TetR/AcrR family transcriptional regulator [Alcaligenaceae bacterium]|nr:TetR/AcrR family transcriptional regulator [Alcaligenaceae bacterium]